MNKTIQIEQTGTTFGYEHYHQEFYLNGELIGSASWDKKQNSGSGLYVGSFEYKSPLWEKHRKSFYGKTPEQIAEKMTKYLTP